MRFREQSLSSCLAVSITVVFLLFTVVVAQSVPDDIRSDGRKTSAIRGRVVTESEQPLPNVIVVVRPVAVPYPGLNTLTDSQGNFQISGLDPGLFFVSAADSIYFSPPVDTSNPVYYHPGDSVTLHLAKGGIITGRVTSASGEPVVQVSVRAVLIRDSNDETPIYMPAPPRERVTDDRGIFRIYGLRPGTYVVSAGGNTPYSYLMNAYDSHVPTFAPSSTRDTAAEITVRAGEETVGVDIRYRGETGHIVSGLVNTPAPGVANLGAVVTMMPLGDKFSPSTFSYPQPGGRGFSFYGVADGDYNLVAQATLGPGEVRVSEPLAIKVRGADLTGIELTPKALGAISGHINLERSNSPECKGKRRPLFAETLVLTQPKEKVANGQLQRPQFSRSQASPDNSGNFVIRDLVSGQYLLRTLFFAKYWFLQSFTWQSPSGGPVMQKQAVRNQPGASVRDWITLKSGERISGLTITLAEGAASLQGHVVAGENEKLSAKSFVYLVPAEKEDVENVLRFFVTDVTAEGKFSFTNLPFGRYWTIALDVSRSGPTSLFKVRSPEESAGRTKLRREAENFKNLIELKPCQNVSDYELSIALPSQATTKPTYLR